jgi:hypothetical protein
MPAAAAAVPAAASPPLVTTTPRLVPRGVAARAGVGVGEAAEEAAAPRGALSK